MPKKCSVFGCSSNYAKGETATVFRLPRNEQERDRWIANLPNKDFRCTNDTVICDKHWPPGFQTQSVQGGHVRQTEPPTIFPNVLTSCIPTPVPPKRSDGNTLTVRNEQQDELPIFRELDAFTVDNFISGLQDMHDVMWFQSQREVCIQSQQHCGCLHDYTLYIDTPSYEYTSRYFDISRISSSML